MRAFVEPGAHGWRCATPIVSAWRASHAPVLAPADALARCQRNFFPPAYVPEYASSRHPHSYQRSTAPSHAPLRRWISAALTPLEYQISSLALSASSTLSSVQTRPSLNQHLAAP